MYGLALAASLLIGLLIWQTTSLSEQNAQTQQYEAKTLASNASVYMGLVREYKIAHPSATGAIADSALSFPSWFQKMAGLNCYMSGGSAYVYFSGMSDQEATDAAFLLSDTLIYGRKISGSVTTSKGVVFSVPSQVPNGSIVFQI